jgi:hypothetical protein
LTERLDVLKMALFARLNALERGTPFVGGGVEPKAQ